jgi:hypothetical protein
MFTILWVLTSALHPAGCALPNLEVLTSGLYRDGYVLRDLWSSPHLCTL